MKKYLYIFTSKFNSSIQYIFNILTGFITYFIVIYIFLNLWKYMYSNPNELINGYTMNQMIWYVIITEVLWNTLKGKKLCEQISDDVKGGNIAYHINKPYNYILYSLSSHLADALIRFIIYILLGIILGILFLGSIPNLNIISILCILFSLIIATIVSSLLIIFIGLLSFIIEDSVPFYWLYSKLILVLGTTFPIEYFPISIRNILKYSPIYVTTYGPAKLFVDFTNTSFLKYTLIGLIYLVISYLLCYILYKKGVKKLNVNGG